MLPALL